MPKYVASRSLDSAPWPGGDDATVLEGDLADAVNELKQQPGGPIGVHGSPTLVEALLRADVLDEMRLGYPGHLGHALVAQRRAGPAGRPRAPRPPRGGCAPAGANRAAHQLLAGRGERRGQRHHAIVSRPRAR